MTKLFTSLAVLLLAASVAGAQPAPPFNAGALPQQQEQAPQCQVLEIAVDEPETGIRPLAGPLVITPPVGPGITAARRVVLQQAINEWQTIVEDSGSTPGNYPIAFSFGPRPPGNLAQTTVAFDVRSGNLISATMVFSDSVTFFEDPTPADDSEFTGGSPPPNTDLLTVARHELGHAVGWITNSRRITDLMVAGAFNPPRLNIPIVTATGQHTDPAWRPNDVMVPTIPVSVRRPISLYPAGGLVARAFDYRIPMQFVDPAHPGTQTGTANQPWRTFLTACAFSPLGTPLLFANSTHLVPAFFRCANRHVVDAARGGAVVRP